MFRTGRVSEVANWLKNKTRLNLMCMYIATLPTVYVLISSSIRCILIYISYCLGITINTVRDILSLLYDDPSRDTMRPEGLALPGAVNFVTDPSQ